MLNTTNNNSKTVINTPATGIIQKSNDKSFFLRFHQKSTLSDKIFNSNPTYQDVKIVDFNEQDIEVKQYLPVNEKLELIGNVINLSHDDNNFANPVKVSIFTTLEIMYAYTNINFTDKIFQVYEQIEIKTFLIRLAKNRWQSYYDICEVFHGTLKEFNKYFNDNFDLNIYSINHTN